ncbi:MAG TPA: hypothetical protein P5334_04905, partial [Candidatus Syntrophosphaera sp.]|nr:hypothetical protein [Candidatus Syntrophosphaera sp.]HRU47847.1 hypothetical protein [Candidatus Syntrophosphaera sp.]
NCLKCIAQVPNFAGAYSSLGGTMISCLQDTYQSIKWNKVQTIIPTNSKTVLTSEILCGNEIPVKVFSPCGIFMV